MLVFGSEAKEEKSAKIVSLGSENIYLYMLAFHRSETAQI
jgi:hypothetical protein